MPSRYHHLHFQWAIFTDLNTQRLNLSVFLGDTIKLHNEASLCYSGYVANVFKDTCIKLQVLVPLDHPLNIRKLLAQPMRMSWMNPWAFCPLLISAVGILLTTEVQSIFLPCYPLPHILIPSPSSPLAPPHLHVCQLQCPVLQREDVKKVFHSVRLKHLREHVDPVTTFWDQSFLIAFIYCQDDLIRARRELGKTQPKAVDFPVESILRFPQC